MRKNRVLLYNPRTAFHTMPLGLLAIGSNLDSNQFEVIIIDGRLVADPLSELKRHLPKALCLGVSVLTGPPIRDALIVSRAIKMLDPDLPVIWGGWHPSLFPQECLHEPSIDVTVQGQGEVTFNEIVSRLSTGATLEHIDGLTFRHAGAIVQNPSRSLHDMNDFLPLNYDLIPVERYFAAKGQRQLDYISSTGCFFRCTFCADPFVYKRKWNAITPNRTGEELELLWRRHRFDDLHFLDETFFTYRERATAVAEELLRRGMKFTWTATMRADQGTRLSEADFALIKESGLRRVLIGVESGSQMMLDRLKKDITIEQIFFAAERCARHDIAVDFPMIVGFPDEPDESLRATLRIAKQLRAMSPRFSTQIFFYQPYPGSPIAELAKDKGYPTPQKLDEWADFDFVKSSGPWVSPEKRELVKRFQFYSRHAWGTKTGILRRALQRLSNWRCTLDYYSFPLEKLLIETLRPVMRLP